MTLKKKKKQLVSAALAALMTTSVTLPTVIAAAPSVLATQEGNNAQTENNITQSQIAAPLADNTDGIQNFAGGDGTKENPYQIATAQQLDAIRNDLSAHYILVDDIDLTNSGSWTPIGTYKSAFYGTLKGNHHTIKGLTINNESLSNWIREDENTYLGYMCLGLFGVIGNDVILSDLTLENYVVDLKPADELVGKYHELFSGGLFGHTENPGGRSINVDITNCTVNGIVNIERDRSILAGSDYSYSVGGLFGGGDFTKSSTISNCTNNANINCITKNGTGNFRIGGICSGLFGTTIEKCINTGDISCLGYGWCGGIAASDHGLSSCINKGKITLQSNHWGDLPQVGGIVAQHGSNLIDQCVNYGDVIAEMVVPRDHLNSGIWAGGICGYHDYNYGDNDGISNCTNYAANINAIDLIQPYQVYGEAPSEKRNGKAGRICGENTSAKLSNNYSVPTTLVNGSIPTENIGADQINGEDLKKTDPTPDNPEQSTQDKLQEDYLKQHIEYYQSSYSKDIVPMESMPGLKFLLKDSEGDLSNRFYKALSTVEADFSMVNSFLNPAEYVDITWNLNLKEMKFSLKVPEASVLDLGSSEYSVILYQLMASDDVYNGILDTFSTNYIKNTKKFAKSISDNVVSLARDPNDKSFGDAQEALKAAAETIQTADVDDGDFVEAFANFEKLANKFLDQKKTQELFKSLSSDIKDAFEIIGFAVDELDSIGKAYQYACWAETYAETSTAFKDVLKQLSEEAKKRSKELQLLDKFGSGDITFPYSEASMCNGLSKSIDSFIKTMDTYSADSHKVFVNQVIDKTGDSCVDIIAGFVTDKGTKALGGSICPQLAAINSVIKSGKTLIDLFTNADDEYKMILSVESLRVITTLLKNVSDKYGEALLVEEAIDPSKPIIPKPVDLSIRFGHALRFDESIKMYRNAMLLACDYGIKYEESKLAAASKRTKQTPDEWYNIITGNVIDAMTRIWQVQASESSTAITLLAYQKNILNEIHCHDDNLDYDHTTGLMKYDGNYKVVTIACPVDVTVLDPNGTRLALLQNGSAIVTPGYEHYFFISPLDDNTNDYVKVAVIPDNGGYQILMDGTDAGVINVFAGEYDGDRIIQTATFANFNITDSTDGYFTSGDTNNPLGYLVLDNKTYGIPNDRRSYAVIFNTSGGSMEITDMVTNTNGKLPNLPIPTRVGYRFDGWYTDANGETKITTDTVLNENTILYARWKNINPDESLSQTYIITFDANNGSISTSNMSTSINGTLSDLPIPTRNNYTFNGWYTASTGGTRVTTDTVFDKDTTLYAQWTSSGNSSGNHGGSSGNRRPSSTATKPVPVTPITPVSPTNTVKLDTSTVNIINGNSYAFLVNGNNDTANIKVEVVNPNVAGVALDNANDPRGAMYRVTAKVAGSTEIKVTYQGQTTSMKVNVTESKGSITLDTAKYILAPGNQYTIGAFLKDAAGNALSAEQIKVMINEGKLKVRDSRTGSIVDLEQLSNSNFRVTGKNEGTAYIIYEVGGTHASVRVDVQKGVQQHGTAVRNTSYFVQ